MTLSTPVQRNICLFTIIVLEVMNERDPHAWTIPFGRLLRSLSLAGTLYWHLRRRDWVVC
jgi:hypothetical protein